MKKMKYIIFSGLITFLGMSSIHAEDMCAVCGADTLPIPIGIPNFVSKLITLAQIAVPVIIIIMAIIKYTKAIASSDEKVMKETNSSFIRSLITGVSIFLVVTIVKFAFSLIGTEYSSYLNCVSCFLNGEDHCSKQVCPDRDGNSISNSNIKSCSFYTSKGTCPTKDDNNNLCYWNSSLNICETGEAAKYCSDYKTEDECPKYDDYGYECKWDMNFKECKTYQEAKWCSDYKTEADCPEFDGHGYTCKWDTTGAYPRCISWERNNEK